MILSGVVIAVVKVMAGVSSVLLNKTFRRNGGIFTAIIPIVVRIWVPRTTVCAADKRTRTFPVIVAIPLSFPTGPVSFAAFSIARGKPGAVFTNATTRGGYGNVNLKFLEVKVELNNDLLPGVAVVDASPCIPRYCKRHPSLNQAVHVN